MNIQGTVPELSPTLERQVAMMMLLLFSSFPLHLFLGKAQDSYIPYTAGSSLSHRLASPRTPVNSSQ